MFTDLNEVQNSGCLLKFKPVYSILLLSLLLIWNNVILCAQVLPLEQKNTITNNWLVYKPESAQLVPFVSNVHTNYNAIHQWLSVSNAQPFEIEFSAPQDLCLLLNNKLVFRADSAATYTFDITKYTLGLEPIEGKYLLTVWHPSQQPNVAPFRNQVKEQSIVNLTSKLPFSARVREYVNQNAFIAFLLLIGIIYGWLRKSFPADFSGIFSLGAFRGRGSTISDSPLSKPVGSWSGILFVLAFSLSMGLVIAAIHTNVQHVRLFNRLFPVSESDITTKILFYSLIIFAFILVKYLFLQLMGFIFGLSEVVLVQYREFLRSILFMGMFLPVIMLLYLSLNAAMPGTILLISNLAVSLLLVLAILRVFFTVNKKAPVLNLHLFSYLCATEVIPLAIILKLIVFNF